jgi:hypothetical protein
MDTGRGNWDLTNERRALIVMNKIMYLMYQIRVIKEGGKHATNIGPTKRS